MVVWPNTVACRTRGTVPGLGRKATGTACEKEGEPSDGHRGVGWRDVGEEGIGQLSSTRCPKAWAIKTKVAPLTESRGSAAQRQMT